MNRGITEVGSDGVSSVLGFDALEVLRHLVKSFVPADALPTLSRSTDRIFEPVLIVMNILQGDGLRADIPAAEWVVLVPADLQSLIAISSDLNPADRFAEIATAIMSRAIILRTHFVSLCLFVASDPAAETSVIYNLSTALQIEFLHRVGLMVLDRLHADRQLLRNLFIRVAVGDERHYLNFPFR